jgi:hypothetical protein
MRATVYGAAHPCLYGQRNRCGSVEAVHGGSASAVYVCVGPQSSARWLEVGVSGTACTYRHGAARTLKASLSAMNSLCRNWPNSDGFGFDWESEYASINVTISLTNYSPVSMYGGGGKIWATHRRVALTNLHECLGKGVGHGIYLLLVGDSQGSTS